ncbi:hypothetical protein AWH48_03690 [Domibacillus aminovorans]|uniref:Uncharacterized protein n=1 Tax=Domibacillus aminovorans TaxID=29332 RepID=A0A177KRP6_9BACI|nr:hypothetical protein AWH48_03690 [Domibacillus aminovorans]
MTQKRGSTLSPFFKYVGQELDLSNVAIDLYSVDSFIFFHILFDLSHFPLCSKFAIREGRYPMGEKPNSPTAKWIDKPPISRVGRQIQAKKKCIY